MISVIFLDHAATTPLSDEARTAMAPWLSGSFGNPSGLYQLGRTAQAAVDHGRTTVAATLGARPTEIIFTSGGTESINTALFGIGYAMKRAGAGAHIITTAIEHDAGLHTCTLLEEMGFEITSVGCDGDGRVDPGDIARALRPDTVLVSVMLANNEVGTIQPVPEIASIVRRYTTQSGHRVILHTDAVQTPGWMPLDVDTLGVDALSLSAHKFGGPQGVGVLYLRRATPFKALHHGGGQEMQKRAGTENVAGIAGTAAALRAAQRHTGDRGARVRHLRDTLRDGILARVAGAVVNSPAEGSLPGVLSVSFPGLESEELVAELDRRDIAASSGSACSNSTWEPSHVLLAMGIPIRRAVGTVRFSLGEETTEREIQHVLEHIADAVVLARSASTARVAS